MERAADLRIASGGTILFVRYKLLAYSFGLPVQSRLLHSTIGEIQYDP
jgi:hypothetical protein